MEIQRLSNLMLAKRNYTRCDLDATKNSKQGIRMLATPCCDSVSFGTKTPTKFINEELKILSECIATPMSELSKDHEIYKKLIGRYNSSDISDKIFISEASFPFPVADEMCKDAENKIAREFQAITDYEGDDMGEFAEMIYNYTNKIYNGANKPLIITMPKFNEIHGELTLENLNKIETRIITALSGEEQGRTLHFMNLPYKCKMKFKMADEARANGGELKLQNKDNFYLMRYDNGYRVDKIDPSST